MVPFNELRIGNYVLYEGAMVFVDGVTDSRVRLYGVKYGTDDGWYLLSDVEGVPLTIDLLKAAGFQLQEDGEVYFLQVGNQLYLECQPDLDGFYINPETWRGSFLDIWSQVKHLHQLQNLYHALTGEELKIKSLTNETSPT